MLNLIRFLLFFWALNCKSLNIIKIRNFVLFLKLFLKKNYFFRFSIGKNRNSPPLNSCVFNLQYLNSWLNYLLSLKIYVKNWNFYYIYLFINSLKMSFFWDFYQELMFYFQNFILFLSLVDFIQPHLGIDCHLRVNY